MGENLYRNAFRVFRLYDQQNSLGDRLAFYTFKCLLDRKNSCRKSKKSSLLCVKFYKTELTKILNLKTKAVKL